METGGELTQKAKEILWPISRKYVENYQRRHGILKVLGMREPVELDDVYVNVQILDRDLHRSFESLDGLEKLYRENQGKRKKIL